MGYHPDQLAALAAVVDEGSFDAAAAELGVTPSAISQRIRALENRAGTVLVQRTSPCAATESGRVLLRLARQVDLLTVEADQQLHPTTERANVVLPVAINADSLATWFVEVMAEAAHWPEVLLHLFVDDQARTARLLRAGTVIAAVTDNPTPVQGCSVDYLGSMRYFAAAAPRLAERWRSATGEWNWEDMPVVNFGPVDGLQREILARSVPGVTAEPPEHQVPSSEAYLTAVRLGLGWGALPEVQMRAEAGQAPDTGAESGAPIMRMQEDSHIDVKLYWQSWRVRTPALDRLTDAVHAVAAHHLRA